MFSVIFVTYNSAEVIADAIRSVPAGNEVIVVDNASTDKSIAISRDLGAKVLEMPKNLGFGTACNRGAAAATADNLLFLNPDARLTPGALEAMERALARYPNSIAFNPRLLNEDGSQFMRRRTILQPRPYLIRPPLPTGDESIIMATGAALWMRKRDFDHLGGFDEKIFLYYEDDDLSARIIKSGRTMHYVHDAIVYHKGRSSSGPVEDTNDFRDYQGMKSRIYVCRKHGIVFRRRLNIIRDETRRLIAKLKKKQDRIVILEARLRALKEWTQPET